MRRGGKLQLQSANSAPNGEIPRRMRARELSSRKSGRHPPSLLFSPCVISRDDGGGGGDRPGFITMHLAERVSSRDSGADLGTSTSRLVGWMKKLGRGYKAKNWRMPCWDVFLGGKRSPNDPNFAVEQAIPLSLPQSLSLSPLRNAHT